VGVLPTYTHISAQLGTVPTFRHFSLHLPTRRLSADFSRSEAIENRRDSRIATGPFAAGKVGRCAAGAAKFFTPLQCEGKVSSKRFREKTTPTKTSTCKNGEKNGLNLTVGIGFFPTYTTQKVQYLYKNGAALRFLGTTPVL